ncbi:GcrA family cell cycle regulator [Pikeienuella sp. HZG-20]|uniref:GcrA family cell cycle regulator n=1 Tax=Paludibacillus litoralis TaxID=3133267 RepID=UPI0030EDF4EA
MSWTDERVEQLTKMWTEGQSASQIAKALGGVTRNAVIGKVHRLGLSNRATAKAAPAAEEAKPAVKPAAAAAANPEPATAAPPPPPPPPQEPKAAPAAPRPVHSAGSRREPPPPTPAMVEDAQRTAEALAEMEAKAKRLNLLELTERTCKWPIGDPATDDFFFCGLACQPGKPYCEAHVAVAFQPMSSRRDRDRRRNRSTGGGGFR